MTEETIDDIKSVMKYLTGKGFYVSKASLYRHITERKLRRNKDNKFDAIVIEKYARKYLKCLDVKNSQETTLFLQAVLNKFFDEIAGEIANIFLNNPSQTEPLKTYLRTRIDEYFRLQAIENPHIEEYIIK